MCADLRLTLSSTTSVYCSLKLTESGKVTFKAIAAHVHINLRNNESKAETGDIPDAKVFDFGWGK